MYIPQSLGPSASPDDRRGASWSSVQFLIAGCVRLRIRIQRMRGSRGFNKMAPQTTCFDATANVRHFNCNVFQKLSIPAQILITICKVMSQYHIVPGKAQVTVQAINTANSKWIKCWSPLTSLAG